ncbi:MAG: chemotaxis protein CheW [Pseudomonadota bacterium]
MNQTVDMPELEGANPVSMGGEPSFMALTFELQDEIFAVDVTNVHEVIDPLPITLVPNSDPFAPGLINARGTVVPVLDLRERLGMRGLERTTDTRFVVLETALGDDRTKFAVVADRVYEVVEISIGSIQAAPDLSMAWPSDFVRGIATHGETLITVLDTSVVFQPELAA